MPYKIGEFLMKDKAVRNLMALIFCITFCVMLIIVVVTTKATMEEISGLLLPLITAFFGFLAGGMYTKRGDNN